MNPLNHFDEEGAPRMVDVGVKKITQRMARAQATVTMAETTLQRIQQTEVAKGDVLEVARLAGIMGAKQTSNLIPLCHPLNVDSVTVDFEMVAPAKLTITAVVKIQARTGVEMEAMTAVSVAALTIYDMCKGIDRDIEIGEIQLLEKTGGRSGHYRRSQVQGGSD